jgi:hypothetical protein
LSRRVKQTFTKLLEASLLSTYSDKNIPLFHPISDPFNGALKRPTQKANS